MPAASGSVALPQCVSSCARATSAAAAASASARSRVEGGGAGARAERGGIRDGLSGCRHSPPSLIAGGLDTPTSAFVFVGTKRLGQIECRCAATRVRTRSSPARSARDRFTVSYKQRSSSVCKTFCSAPTQSPIANSQNRVSLFTAPRPTPPTPTAPTPDQTPEWRAFRARCSPRWPSWQPPRSRASLCWPPRTRVSGSRDCAAARVFTAA